MKYTAGSYPLLTGSRITAALSWCCQAPVLGGSDTKLAVRGNAANRALPGVQGIWESPVPAWDLQPKSLAWYQARIHSNLDAIQ